MYNLAIKSKRSSGFCSRTDIVCKTPQEALNKLHDIKNQDDKDSWVIASCLYEMVPLAYNEEEIKKLINKGLIK